MLALYGLTLPNMHIRKCQESKYAPIMGLFGASVELIIKSCLVQGKGLEVMYKNNDLKSGVYKFGTDVLKEFKTSIKIKARRSLSSGRIQMIMKSNRLSLFFI